MNAKTRNLALCAIVGLTAVGAKQVEKPFAEDDDRVLLARMLYGEARNCSDEEKVAIAFSAINRVNDGKSWNGRTLREVILCPKQYSCFNPDDKNFQKVTHPYRDDILAWNRCLNLSYDILNRKYSDPTRGATHYHTSAVHPKWAKSKKMISLGRLGNSRHKFYREK